MMMALARQIPEANSSTHAGKWEKSRFVGVELYAKTLGLVGCGNIGSIVADRAQGLKMKVIAYDPFLSPERAVDLGVEKVDLDTLLPAGRFHPPAHAADRRRPATSSTRSALAEVQAGRSHHQLRARRPDRRGRPQGRPRFSGHVAGAALDVFPTEPATDNILFGHPNVVCTPHLGASSTEAQLNVAIQIAEQMSDFLLHGAVTNALNMPSVTVEEAPQADALHEARRPARRLRRAGHRDRHLEGDGGI